MKKVLVLALAMGLFLAGAIYAVAYPGNPGNDGQTWTKPPLGDSEGIGPSCDSELCCGNVCDLTNPEKCAEDSYAVKECARPEPTDTENCVCEEWVEVVEDGVFDPAVETCDVCEMECCFSCDAGATCIEEDA
jgi:hypothetical protein